VSDLKDEDHWRRYQMVTDHADFVVDDYLRQVGLLDDVGLRLKLEEWRDVGVVTFERVVDETIIELLLNDIVYLSENRRQYELEIEYRGRRLNLMDAEFSPLSDTGTKFNCLENLSLAARYLSLNRTVCGFLKHVFQDQPIVVQSLTFWRGSEQPAHLDYAWVCIQTKLPHLAASWIPLEDVHPDAGPLAYYPGSHKADVIPPFDWGSGSLIQEKESEKSPEDFVRYLAECIQRKNLKKRVFLPRRGDALIWHGNMLHGGEKVNDASRTRKSYVTHYTSLNAYPSNFHFPDRRGTIIGEGAAYDHPWVGAPSVPLPSWTVLSEALS
jgi:phytanoyl-CoA hydroxylase